MLNIKNRIPQRFLDTEAGLMSESEADESRLDQRRAVYDFLKHLMTLDTGALVLIATLAEKVFPHATNRAMLAISVFAFALSLAAGGTGYLVLLAQHPRVGALRASASDRSAALWSLSSMFVGFLVGIGALAWFFNSNWLII